MAVREHKKSYEIYLIHHAHSQSQHDSRKYSKLASIPKYRLNLHDERIDQISAEKTIKLTFEQTLAIRSVLHQLESSVSKESVPSDPLVVDSDYSAVQAEEIIAE
jgi:hypothetical protein